MLYRKIYRSTYVKFFTEKEFIIFECKINAGSEKKGNFKYLNYIIDREFEKKNFPLILFHLLKLQNDISVYLRLYIAYRIHIEVKCQKSFHITQIY